MVDKQISNPAGAWGLAADTNAQVVVEVVNNSGGTLLPGDVVVIDATGTLCTTTTTANDPLVFGVVLPTDRGLRTVASTETYAAGAVMPVCVRGPARINIAANAVVIANGPLASSGVAKVAIQTAAAASVAALQALIGTFIASPLQASGSKDANNTIVAQIGKM